MYYGFIYLLSGILCPLSLMFIISFNMMNSVNVLYMTKTFNLVFLLDELSSLDFFGSSLFLMTWILTFGCILTIFQNSNSSNMLSVLTVFMTSCSVNVYLASHLLEFYVSFELTLFPILFMILGWGYQPERFSAGFALLLYTIIGSIPFLGMLVFLNHYHLIVFFQLNSFSFFNSLTLVSLFMSSAFLIKLPMFLVHSWLPKAHVEAPVYGSMFLAGTLLKLGGIGLIRVSSLLSSFWLTSFLILALISLIYVGALCTIMSDMKVIIAYSSVAHMGLALIMVFCLTNLSLLSSLMIFITHGLSSSTMFLLAYILYSRSNSRSLLLNQNITLFSPILTMIWFLSCVGLMGGPPSSTLLSELMGMSFMASNWLPSIFFLIGGAFLGGAYSILLYVRTSHGFKISMFNSLLSLNSKELLMSKFHLFWLFFYFLIFPWVMMQFFKVLNMNLF